MFYEHESTKLNSFVSIAMYTTCITKINHLFIHSSMITQFYFKQFIKAQVKVKWFQVLLYITNNSIKQLSFV